MVFICFKTIALLPDIANITASVGLSISFLTCQNLDPAFNAILYDGICEQIPTGFRKLWISQLITVIMLILSMIFAVAIYPNIYSQGCCNMSTINRFKALLSRRGPVEVSEHELQSGTLGNDCASDPSRLRLKKMDLQIADETAEIYESSQKIAQNDQSASIPNCSTAIDSSTAVISAELNEIGQAIL